MGGVPSVFEGGFLPKHFVRGGPIGKFQVIDSNQHPSYKYPGYFSSFSDAQRQRLLADLIGKPRVYDGDGQLDSTRSGAGINIAELQAEELVKLTLQLHSRVKVQWFFRNWVQVQWGRLKLFAEELGDMVSLLEARNPQQFKQGFCRCAGHGDYRMGAGGRCSHSCVGRQLLSPYRRRGANTVQPGPRHRLSTSEVHSPVSRSAAGCCA